MLDTTNPEIATFTPSADGEHSIRLTVTDPPLAARPSSSTPSVVTVHVGRQVTHLGSIVLRDADIAHGAGVAGLAVLVGPNPSNASQGMLWRIDLDSGRPVGTGIV